MKIPARGFPFSHLAGRVADIVICFVVTVKGQKDCRKGKLILKL